MSETKTTLRKIIDTSKEKRDRIASILKSRQSVYSAIEKRIEGFENICTELYVFGLLGFVHIIEIREMKWQMKMIFSAAAILAIGVALLAHLLVVGVIICMKVVDVWSLAGGKPNIPEEIPKISGETLKFPEWIPKLGNLSPLL